MKVADFADKVLHRLADDGYPGNRSVILEEAISRRASTAYLLGVSEATAERYLTEDAVEAWVKSIKEGAATLGFSPVHG